jgi:hypothetical protein
VEKRKEMRIKKRILSSLEDKPAIIVDISQSGIKISMNRPPKTQNVDIKLQINGRVIVLKGDIRWINRMVSTNIISYCPSPADTARPVISAQECPVIHLLRQPEGVRRTRGQWQVPG